MEQMRLWELMLSEAAAGRDYESLQIWNDHFAYSKDPKNDKHPINAFPQWDYLPETDRIWLDNRFTLWAKSRRLFYSWRFIGNYVWDAIAHSARYTFFQSRELSDAGLDVEYALLWRAHFMWEQLPKCLNVKCQMKKKHSLLYFPDTGSTIRAVSADFDAFRTFGATGILLDEVAMQQHPELAFVAARPAVEEFGRLTGVSTPNGENFFHTVSHIEGDYEIMPEYKDFAISKWRPVQENANGFVTVFPHYSCHPERDPATDAGRAWQKEARRGVATENDWRREQEIDFQAHSGEPIFPRFDEKVHCRELDADGSLLMLRGWDPVWRHAVCVWVQVKADSEDDKNPQVRVLREHTSLDADIGVLGDRVLEMQDKEYDDFKGRVWDHIDAAGAQHSQTSKHTAIEILGHMGITARYKKCSPEDRILQLNYLLNNKTKDGEPCFLMDRRHCPRLYKAMRGLYRRKEGSTIIEQNEACHYVDALGYALLPNVYLPRKKEKPQEKKRDSGWLKEVIGLGRKDAPNWKGA